MPLLPHPSPATPCPSIPPSLHVFSDPPQPSAATPHPSPATPPSKQPSTPPDPSPIHCPPPQKSQTRMLPCLAISLGSGRETCKHEEAKNYIAPAGLRPTWCETQRSPLPGHPVVGTPRDGCLWSNRDTAAEEFLGREDISPAHATEQCHSLGRSLPPRRSRSHLRSLR